MFSDDKNNLIVRKNLIHSGLSPLEIFYLMRIIDALPPQYRNSLTNNTHNSRNAFVLTDHFVLRLNNQNVTLCKALSIQNLSIVKYDPTLSELHEQNSRKSLVGLASNGMRSTVYHLQ